MDIHKRRQLQVTLRQLAEAHAKTVAKCLADAIQVLGAAQGFTDLDYSEPRRPARQIAESSVDQLIDQPMLSVVYRGKRCFLGNSLPFRLMRRLTDQPNRYISNEQLAEDVWRDIVSKEAVRSVVKVLRAKLRGAGLSAVAAVIDGTVRGHYALMLDRL
jgi:DNA-binding response OmpR family regulator